MAVKISVIIPVYNVSLFLDKCISTCINQSFQDIEIIVVNDGSTDCSQSIVDKYAEMDKRIIPVLKENEGLLLARLSGLAIAKGCYVFHLDGDDYLPEDALRILYDTAIENDLDYVMGDYYYSERNSVTIRERNDLKLGVVGRELYQYLLLNDQWDLHGKLIKKSLYDNFIYKPIFMGEDLFQNLQLSLKIRRSGIVHQCVYYYVIHEAAITQCKDEEKVFLLDYQMMDSIFLLIDSPVYDFEMKCSVYKIFCRHISLYIKKNKIELKDIVKKYLWKDRETIKIIFRTNKLICFLSGCYLCVPHWVSFFVNKYSYFHHLLNRIRQGIQA